MRRNGGILTLLLALAVTGLARPAAAFWPLQRGEIAVADTLTPERLQQRFDLWKVRGLKLETKPDSAAHPAVVTPGAQTLDASMVAELARKKAASNHGKNMDSFPPPKSSGNVTIVLPNSSPQPATPTTPATPATPDSARAPVPGAAATVSKSADPPVSQPSTPSSTPPTPPVSTTTTVPSPPDSTNSASPDSTRGAAAADSTASDSTKTTPLTPSQVAQAQAASVNLGFAPKLVVSLSSSSDRMTMNSSLDTHFADPSGASLGSTLTYGDDLSLTQNNEQKSRTLTNSFNMPLRTQGLSLQLSTMNTKNNGLTRSIANARFRNNIEARGAQASIVMQRAVVSGVRPSFSVSRNFNQNDQNTIQTLGSGGGERHSNKAGNAYGAGVGFDRFKWLKLTTRYGRATTSNQDRSPGLSINGVHQTEAHSTSRGDSASAEAALLGAFLGVSKVVLQTRIMHSEDNFTDVASTSRGTLGGDLNSYVLERRQSYSRSLHVAAAVNPPLQRVFSTAGDAMRRVRIAPAAGILDFVGEIFGRLKTDVTMDVSRDSTAYKIRANQFSDTRKTSWSFDSKLECWKQGSLHLKFTNDGRNSDQDEPSNPVNPLTGRNVDRRFRADFSQDFTKTMKASMYGEIQLTQGFFVHEGPQGLNDKDEVHTSLGVDLDGRMNEKATGHVTAYVRRYNQAYLSNRRSSASANETEYVVRPSFAYNVSKSVSVRQDFGLSSRVIDGVFDTSLNSLSRNHYMRTTLNYAVTARMAWDASIDYLLLDNGAYTFEPGSPVRVFSPSTRTKKDGIGIGLHYDVLPEGKLTFVSKQEMARDHNTSFLNGTRVTVSQRGNLALGLDSKLKAGEFLLDCRLTRNQNFNVALNRKVFFNVESSLSYTF